MSPAIAFNNMRRRVPGRSTHWLLGAALLYACVPGLDSWLAARLGFSVGAQLTYLFIYSLLALGLNVIVGFTGLLHLGIAAFFGIGAYATSVLMVRQFPFQTPFIAAVLASTFLAAFCGALLGAPTLRLRGDYLAIVTLGFGEVVRFAFKNLEEITGGSATLNPLPTPQFPSFIADALTRLGLDADWSSEYRWFYLLTLAVLAGVMALLGALECSRIGRAWVAVREDELAATCMGINAARVKLSAMALGAGIAGLAGSFYAAKLAGSGHPDYYDFTLSVNMLCCVILGGLGNVRGAVLGAVLLMGFNNVLTPFIDRTLQASINPSGNPLLAFSSYSLLLFGLALILVMRFRPEGLLPSKRMQYELHEDAATRPGALP